MWVKLSGESLQQLGCSAGQAFALSYNAEKKEQYLIEKEVNSSSSCITCLASDLSVCVFFSLHQK